MLRPLNVQASDNDSIEASLLVRSGLDDRLPWSENIYQHGPLTAVPVLLDRVFVI